MKLIRNLFFVAFGIFVFVAPLRADSGQKIYLSDSVKAALIAAKPVQGTSMGVDQNAFDGRPVLVSFFASWWTACKEELAQLRKFLNEKGTDKLSVIAISRTEGRYGNPSPSRLKRTVREFHPAIRVISETPNIVKAFSPLVYVPANFIFDRKGRLVFGDGNREPLDKDDVARLIKGL